mmetsp:Transcript_11590/g.17539  ORF Transcript_11590/g.17539 Transcript_11590/m.17539 type:complete len:211 (+) Transcript_11590:456-1088(+)
MLLLHLRWHLLLEPRIRIAWRDLSLHHRLTRRHLLAGWHLLARRHWLSGLLHWHTRLLSWRHHSRRHRLHLLHWLSWFSRLSRLLHHLRLSLSSLRSTCKWSSLSGRHLRLAHYWRLRLHHARLLWLHHAWLLSLHLLTLHLLWRHLLLLLRSHRYLNIHFRRCSSRGRLVEPCLEENWVVRVFSLHSLCFPELLRFLEVTGVESEAVNF